MNTLVYHTGALGDFVTILPAISLWRGLNPGARIDYLGKRAHGQLGKAAGYFSEVLDIDQSRFASLFSEALSNDLSSLVSSYDSCIVFADNESPVLGHCARLVHSVYHQPPFPDDQRHVVERRVQGVEERSGAGA